MWMQIKSGHLFLVIWVVGFFLTIAFSIVRYQLICCLRERYPELYERVGKPAMISKETMFIWELGVFKDELDFNCVSLLKKSRLLLVGLWVVFVCGVGVVLIDMLVQ